LRVLAGLLSSDAASTTCTHVRFTTRARLSADTSHATPPILLASAGPAERAAGVGRRGLVRESGGVVAGGA